MLEFGIEVKDTITGFQGFTTGRASYITGCDQYLVQPSVDKEGKRIDPIWIDEPRLEVVVDGRTIALKADIKEDPGPCEPAPAK